MNPGVPAGTRTALIFGVPSSFEPVRAVTVTTEVRSVPELVMNALAPLTTHSLPVAHGLGARGPGVRPGTGLGQAEAGQGAAGDEVGQPALLLRVGAVAEDRVDAQADARREGDADRLVDPAELLDRDDEAHEVGVRPAVLLRRGEAEEAEVAHLRHELGGEVRVAVPLLDVRGDLALGEVADDHAEVLVLLAQLEHGGCLSS